MTAEPATFPPTPVTRLAPRAGLGAPDTLALALVILAISPYLLAAYPPISDLPNHAARLFLECHRQDPGLKALYVVRPALIPNLSLDLVGLGLCGILAPVVAVKALLIASLAVMAAAGWVIQRKVYGRTSVGLLAFPATAASLVTLMGYVNFLSGVAVLACMVALLIDRLEDRRWTLAVGSIGGAALFLCHVFALGLGMVVFFGLMLDGSLRPRRMASAARGALAMFALPLVLVAMAEHDRQPITVRVGDKLFALIVPLLSGPPTLLETGLLVIFVVSLGVALALRRRATDRRLLLAFALAAAYAFCLPFQINDAIDIGARTMAAAIPLVALAIPPAPARREGPVFAAACVALLVFHLVGAARVWPTFGRQIGELRAALSVIPAGSRVLSVWPADGPAPGQIAPSAAYAHLAAYAVIDRQAFNPLEFMGRGMQPLSPAPALTALTPPPSRPLVVEDARMLARWSGPPTPALVQVKQAYAIRWTSTFDRVIYLHFGAAPNFDPERLQILATGSFFSILQPRPAAR